MRRSLIDTSWLLVTNIAEFENLHNMPLYDPKLNEVQNLSLTLIEHRGRVTEIRLDDFIAAGFNHGHIPKSLSFSPRKS